MLQGSPLRRDEKAAAAFGLSAAEVWGGDAQDQDGELQELWPEHVTPVALFQRMRGQWRMGACGPVALDYGALDAVARMLRIKRGELRQAFEPLRVMEAEALAWFAEQMGD